LEDQEALRRATDAFRELPRLIGALHEGYSRLGIGVETMRFLQEQEKW
jgi:hypothetical protein